MQGRRIDAFIEDTGVLIEQKAPGVDLDKAEQRGRNEGGDKRMVTPYEQAKWYAEKLPHKADVFSFMVSKANGSVGIVGAGARPSI